MSFCPSKLVIFLFMVYYWNVHAFDDITQLSVYSYKHPSLSFPSMLYFFSRRRKSASNARKLLEKGKKRPQVCVNEGTIDRCKPREISCLTTTHYYNSEWQKGYSSQAQDCDFRSVHRERMRCSVARLTHCPHHYTNQRVKLELQRWQYGALCQDKDELPG